MAGTLDISVPLLVDLKEVMPYLEKSSDKDGGNAGLHTALGGLYINLGAIDPKRKDRPDYDPPEFGLAQRHLDRAIALAPSMELPRYYMGLLEVHRQDYDKALAYMKQALELNPKDLRVHQQIHTLYFASRKYATAALFLEDSIKVLPKEPNLYHRLSATYMALNRLQKSIEYSKKALALAYDPETDNLLATVYMRQENYRLSENEFRQVLKRYPENINAMLGIARTYMLRGDSSEALKWIGHALSVERDNKEALLLLKEIQEGKEKDNNSPPKQTR